MKYLALPALLALFGLALIGCARQHRDLPSASFAPPPAAQQP